MASSLIPYLILVSFLTPNFHKFDLKAVEAINASPYSGVAIQLVNAYDTNNHTEAEFAAQTEFLRANVKKQVWPWVFFNRIIGKAGSDKPYFAAIRGMALDEHDEALRDFYTIWRLALRTAKKLGAPGIFIDPEAYNNYQYYYVGKVAALQGKTDAAVQQQLANIGRELITIAQEEYPTAILWFTFSGLAGPIQGFRDPAGKLTTSSYIIKGMLDACKQKNSGLTIVSGGMTSLGYCFKSLQDLENVIQKRAGYYHSVLATYPHLKLGGTIAPWLNHEKKRGWMLKGKCQTSALKNIEDFKPLIKKLRASYPYVWIYAAAVSGFNPFEPASAVPSNQVIAETSP